MKVLSNAHTFVEALQLGFPVSVPRLDATIEAIRSLEDPAIVDIRIVGSTALAVLARAPHQALLRLSLLSDIDLHVIVKTDPASFYTRLVHIDPQHLATYDILAAKLPYRDFLLSVHVYSASVFRELCGFRPRVVRLFRNTLGQTRFTYPGLSTNRRVHWQHRPAIASGYSVEFEHKPIVDNRFFMSPYQNMAVLGLNVSPHSPLGRPVDAFLRRFSHQIVHVEKCPSIAQGLRLFRACKQPLPPPLLTNITTALGREFHGSQQEKGLR
jgi:hypothetical protein